MKLLRRIGAPIVLILCTIGILCCIAAVVAVWMFRQAASGKVENVAERLDTGLQRALDTTNSVHLALAQARDKVASVNEESAHLRDNGDKKGPTTVVLRKLIREQLGPRVNELDGRMATLSDAAVAVTSLLESLQELPAAQSRVNTEKLERLAEQAPQLVAALQRLQATVSDGDREVAGQEVAAAASQVDLVLQRCQGLLEDWQSDLDAARQDLLQVKTKALTWLLRATIAVTVIGAWVAVSQVSLFVHAWKWWRSA
jgi:hypothetical protein